MILSLRSFDELHGESVGDVVTLTHGVYRCELLLALGGSIGCWTVDGEAMLRPASIASFPVVPYSNRIDNGSFEWHGRRFALPRNFSPEPHAIHGVGFERPWQVRALTPNSATLVLTHRPCASWPFAFEAQQHIVLGAHTLTIEMSAPNLEKDAVPLAFGHHPYFRREGPG